eukprot:Platyproteum_vivax@DN8974_c0_g1_i1.p1
MTKLYKDNFYTPHYSYRNYVPTYGWSKQSLILAADDAGLSPASGALYSPLDVAYYFMDECLEKLRADAQKPGFFDPKDSMGNKLSFEDKVGRLLQLRIAYLAPYVSSWRVVMAAGAVPCQLNDTLNRLFVLADTICELAEEPADHAGTLRRLGIMGLYSSAEVFSLTDNSANLEETQAYVTRRLDEAGGLLRCVSSRMVIASSISSILPSLLYKD